MRRLLAWTVAVVAAVFVGGGLLIAFGPGVELTNQLLALAGLAAGVAAVAVAVLVASPSRSAAPAARTPRSHRRMSENTTAIVLGALALAAGFAAPAVFYVGELVWLDLPVPGWRTVIREGYMELFWVYRLIWVFFLIVSGILCWSGIYEKQQEYGAADG